MENLVETTETEVEETNNEPNVEEVNEVEDMELTDTSEESQEEQEIEENVQEEIEEEHPEYTKTQVQEMMKNRLKRADKSYKDKTARLINTFKAGGYESEDLDNLITEVENSYKEQGIEIPNYSQSREFDEKHEKALARVDADEVIELGEIEMESRFTELYNKENRTIREEEEMKMIGMEASRKEAKREFIKLGLNPDEMMNNEKFLKFASKISADVPVGEIYQMFTKITGTEAKVPKSPGSIKSKSGGDNVKDYYTPKEAKNFSREQIINNPKLAEAIENSMAKWK